MSNFPAPPRLPGFIVSSLCAFALIAAFVPATAFAEEPPLPPALALSPVTFASTTVQTESAAQEIDVVNNGGEDAFTESPYIEGPAGGEFKIVDNGCAKVLPGEHCTIKVSFAPGGEAGEREATLVLPSSNAPAVSTPLHATAVVAILSFEPEPLDFGLVRINQGVSTTVGLLNSGEGRVQIDSFGFGGPDSGNFGNGNNNCNGAWLEPGQGCFIEVWFNPRQMRGYEAFLEVHAGPQTFALELLGTGGNAELASATNPVQLGSATVGSHGAVQAIELTNVGNMEGGYFIAVVAGGNAASFQLMDENCTGVPIAPNGTCTVHVRFAPQAAGPMSARLALFGDGEGGTLIELKGEGIAPAAALTPSGFDFGSLAVGSRGVPHTFVLSNTGGGSIELGGVSVVGADADQFSLAGDECTDAALGAGEQCEVRVRFAPDSAGAKTARLRIGGGGPFTATLAGIGAVPEPNGREPQAGGTAPAKLRHRRNGRFRRNATIIATRAIR